MADEEKNELTEATEEATEVSDTGVVSDTGAEPEAAAEPAAVAQPEEVSDTTEVDAPAPVSEEVSDTSEVDAPAPVAEAVSDTSEVAPAAPAKKRRSLKHVPRPARRTRSKVAREKPATRKPITRLEKPESELGRRQERRGVVVSDKGNKTIIVKVDVIKSHPKYKKVIRRTAKFHAHDETNTAGVGDKVRIVETRPLSKTKHWRLVEIVEKAK